MNDRFFLRSIFFLVLAIFLPTSVSYASLRSAPPSTCDAALGSPSSTQIVDVAVLYTGGGSGVHLAPVYALIDLGFSPSIQLTAGQTVTVKGKICIPSIAEDFSSYSASPLVDPEPGFYGVNLRLVNISLPGLRANATTVGGAQTVSAYTKTNTDTPWVSDINSFTFRVPASGKYSIEPELYKVEGSYIVTGSDISTNSIFFSGAPNMSIEPSESGNPSNTLFYWKVTGDCTRSFGSNQTGYYLLTYQTILSPGSCTVTWLNRDGYTTPPPTTLTLSSGVLTRFVGNYVKISSSDITVSAINTLLKSAGEPSDVLNLRVENKGTQNISATFSNRLEIASKGDGSDPSPIVSTLNINGLSAGATQTLLFPFDSRTLTGVRYARVCADSGGAITETNESNNCSDWWPIGGIVKITSNITSDALWTLTCSPNYGITHDIFGNTSTAPLPGTTQGTNSTGGQRIVGYYYPGDCTIVWHDVSKTKADGTLFSARAPTQETKRLDSGQMIVLNGDYTITSVPTCSVGQWLDASSNTCKTGGGGSCGTATTQSFSTLADAQAASSLCQLGTPVVSFDSTTNKYVWTCGSNSCSATALIASCGTASGVSTAAAPTANLCGAGNVASPVSDSGIFWSWTCFNGGASKNCTAPKVTPYSLVCTPPNARCDSGETIFNCPKDCSPKWLHF